MPKKVRREVLAVCVSASLFLTSLTQNGFRFEGSNWTPAWMLLLIGWLGLAYGVVAWLANPAILVAYNLILKNKYKEAAIASLIAVVSAGSFLFNRTIVSSEAPTFSAITGYGTGYWLWLASAVVMSLSSIYLAYTSSKEVPGIVNVI